MLKFVRCLKMMDDEFMVNELKSEIEKFVILYVVYFYDILDDVYVLYMWVDMWRNFMWYYL